MGRGGYTGGSGSFSGGSSGGGSFSGGSGHSDGGSRGGYSSGSDWGSSSSDWGNDRRRDWGSGSPHDTWESFPTGPAPRPRHYAPGPRRPKTCGEIISDFILTLIVIIIVFAIIFVQSGGCSRNNFSNSSNSASVVENQVQREKLDSNLIKTSNQWIDDQANWLTDTSKVKSALQYFYDKTGVQPYLMIYDNIENKTTDSSIIEQFMQNKMDTLFEDQGHIIFLFYEPKESEFYRYILTGAASDTVVDSNACDIIYSITDKYYVSDLNENDYFCKIFRDSADKMMKKVVTKAEVSKSRIFVIGGIIIIFLIGFFGIRMYKLKIKEQEQAKEILDKEI